MKRQELEALTVFELRKLARAHKVVGTSSMKKDELVDALVRVRVKAPAAAPAKAAPAKAAKAAPAKVTAKAATAKAAPAKSAPAKVAAKAAPPKAAPAKVATPRPKSKASARAGLASEPTQKAIAALDELLARSHAAAAEAPAEDPKPAPAPAKATAKSSKTPRPAKAGGKAAKRPTEPPAAPPELPEQPPHEATHRLEAVTADGSSPPPHEPAQMLDLAELPDAYGIDVADLRARDPYWLLAHWEITPGRIAEGHRLVGQDARLVLRLYPALEPHAPPIDDVVLPTARGRWFLRAPAPGLSVRGQVGLRARDGRFVGLCDTPAARVPHAEPASMHDPVWMRVAPPDLRVRGAAGRPAERVPAPVLIDRVLYPYVPPVEEPAPPIREAPRADAATPWAMHVTPPPQHARPAVPAPPQPAAAAPHGRHAPEPEPEATATGGPSSPGHAWGAS